MLLVKLELELLKKTAALSLRGQNAAPYDSGTQKTTFKST